MGHTLGLADDCTPAARENVMYGFLTPGERRLPFRDQALDAQPDHDGGIHYAIAPINIGILPSGKSITLTFRVTVANPMPPGTCVISNQGSVTANGATVLTDDPRTAATLDPTLTTVLGAPAVVTQPATVITGTSATLNGVVTPCGTNASYFFQYGATPAYGNNTALANLPVSGNGVAVSAPIAGLTAGARYCFRLVANNSFGSNVGANLTFATLLEIFEQPASTGACFGNSATFSVAASAANVTYQWQRRAPGSASFQNIPGATAATYVTPAVRAIDDGSVFRVVVTGPGTSITSTEAFLSVISVSTPTVTYRFNSGLPPGTALYGHAFIDPLTGVLELNTNAPSQSGAFLTTELAPGRFVQGFAATFKARLLGGSAPPADGFSFNWAADLPNSTYTLGEEGEGSGLRVTFDTWDNSLSEAPAIEVWWSTNLVVRRPVAIPFLVRGPDFFDVAIRLTPDGLLDLSYACEPIFTRLPVTGYTPQMGARFGLGSCTGAAFETHSIDDLALQLFLDPTAGVPRITSIVNQSPGFVVIRGTGDPGANVALHGSIDLNTWAWRANVTPNANGQFQFVEDTSLARYRFYRLAAAPQFPEGLITWWRAENDLLDSIGPNNGSAFGVAPSFVPGIRGQAFSFSVTNQAMFIGGASVPVPWTACFWVRRQDGFGVSSALLTSPSGGLKLEQFGTSRLVGFTAFGVADYSFTYSVPTNVWTHLTFVAAPGGMVLYTNGVAAATHPATIDLPMNILGLRETGLDQLRAQLDETVLFQRALSPAEIRQVINTTRGP